MERYFLSVTLAGEKIEREVTIKEFCMAERQAGFTPKISSRDPRYMTTPATGGFSSTTSGISGRVEWVPLMHPACAAAGKVEDPPKDGASAWECETYPKWEFDPGIRNAVAIASVAAICLSAAIIAMAAIKW